MSAMITMTDDVLKGLRARKNKGESLRALAGEVGVPWQKLEKAIRRGSWARPADRPIRSAIEPAGESTTADLPPARPDQTLLAAKYRPARLDQILGQAKVVSVLKTFCRNPHPSAFLLEGETGTGKTSAALALAEELGCGVAQQELGGVWMIASGEQGADAVRQTCERMWHTPMFGSGWKVVIVNEADRMSAAAETIWLDRLEQLPPRTVFVFTTNHAHKLSQRFADRTIRLTFEDRAKVLTPVARRLAASIWKAELSKDPTEQDIARLIGDATTDRKISFRRLLQVLQLTVMDQKTTLTPDVP